MKIIRYRKPSMKTILGYTRAKRKLRRAVGISQLEGWTKPTRIKQKLKYRLGIYSPAVRAIRNIAKGRFPSFLGMFGRKK